MAEEQSSVTYRDVPEFPGYRVGDDGSVWSRWKQDMTCRRGSRTVLTDVWRRLATPPHRVGYPGVTLCRDGRKYTRAVHSLVLLAFVGPRPDGMESAHENGCRTDNRLENLSYKTHSANQHDRIRHGTDEQGERNATAKLTDEAVRQILASYVRGKVGYERLAKRFNVTPRTIYNVVNGKRWTHVKKEDSGE